MSEPKFTKGPWKCIAAEFKGGDLIAYEIDFPAGQGVISMPNAHLIAAAPELYEALENLLRAVSRDQYVMHNLADSNVVADAQESLAKARGESSEVSE